jgi:hypothetical protein
VTGDGRTDILARDEATGQWQVGRSNGYKFLNESWGDWDETKTWVDVQAGDFDGDGKHEVAGRVENTGDWYIVFSSGAAFVNPYWATWGDPTATSDQSR